MRRNIPTIDRRLLEKYDRPGPRYTSYPTVPEWTSEFGPDEYIEALKRASQEGDRGLAMYIHIPFCAERCSYCGCTTVITRNQNRADAYLDQLSCEIETIAGYLGERRSISQLHWGGGTPTFLTLDQIKRLMHIIESCFSLDTIGEQAIEVDPRVTSAEQVMLLRRLGFNRISLGVQDLSADVQHAIGRHQTAEQTKTLFDTCRRAGFSGINVDVIYGLPHQRVSQFRDTLTRLIDWGVDRVAVYSFAYLPQAKPHQKLIDPSLLPSASAKYDLFATAVETFLSAGYIQIGMDHFATPHDELSQALADGRLYRNFMGYTIRRNSDSIGIGMSAISEIAGSFAQNISKVDSYQQAIADNGIATFRGCLLSQDDTLRQQAILSIMCNFVLDFDAFDANHGIDSRLYFADELKAVAGFAADGLVELSEDCLRVLPAGRMFVRNVAMVFDAYLTQEGAKDGPTFSRTI